MNKEKSVIYRMGPDILIISDSDLNNVIKTSYTPYPNFSLLKALV